VTHKREWQIWFQITKTGLDADWASANIAALPLMYCQLGKLDTAKRVELREKVCNKLLRLTPYYTWLGEKIERWNRIHDEDPVDICEFCSAENESIIAQMDEIVGNLRDFAKSADFSRLKDLRKVAVMVQALSDLVYGESGGGDVHGAYLEVLESSPRRHLIVDDAP